MRAFSRTSLRALGVLLFVGAFIALFANPGNGANLISLLQPPALIQTATANNNAATSLTATFTTTPVAGHLLLCGFAYSTGTVDTVNIPTGWTLDKYAADGTTNIGIAVAHHLYASGDPTSYTFSLSGTGGNVGVGLTCGEYIAAGVDSASLSVVTSAVTQSTTAFSTPSVTLQHRAALPIAFVAINQTGLTHTTSGWTEDAFVQTTTGGQNVMMQMLEPTSRPLNIGATASATTTYNNSGSYHGINAVVTLLPNSGSFSQKVAIGPTPAPTPSCCSNAVQWPASFEPYASSSVWNRPISNITSPTLYPNSDSIVNHAMTTSMSQQLWATDINLSNTCTGGSCAADPAHPWYFATNSDPVVNVNCTTSGGGTCGHSVSTMYIPAKARPGNIGGDSHIAVVQPDGTEIDTWRTTYPSGDWGTAGNTTITAATVNTCGNFYNGPGFTGNTDSSTVGDACLMGGVIRENEAAADAVGDSGTIKHALFITMQCGTRNAGNFVYPAQQVFDNACGDGQPSFYNGAHLWSDYTDAQVDALYPGAVGTNDAVTRAILKAMHHYGGYLLDSGGGAQTAQQPNFFFEDSGQYTAINGANTSPWATFGASNSWGHNTGGAFGTANYWTFNGSFNPLSAVGGWPAHLHWIDPCYAQGTC